MVLDTCKASSERCYCYWRYTESGPSSDSALCWFHSKQSLLLLSPMAQELESFPHQPYNTELEQLSADGHPDCLFCCIWCCSWIWCCCWMYCAESVVAEGPAASTDFVAAQPALSAWWRPPLRPGWLWEYAGLPCAARMMAAFWGPSLAQVL